MLALHGRRYALSPFDYGTIRREEDDNTLRALHRCMLPSLTMPPLPSKIYRRKFRRLRRMLLIFAALRGRFTSRDDVAAPPGVIPPTDETGSVGRRR